MKYSLEVLTKEKQRAIKCYLNSGGNERQEWLKLIADLSDAIRILVEQLAIDAIEDRL